MAWSLHHLGNNLFMSAPLTSELVECLESIREMSRRIRGVIARHREMTGVSGDAEIFCENVEGYLTDTFLNQNQCGKRTESDAYLAFMKESADRAEMLAEKLSGVEGDPRPGEALKILAQSLRFAMPPLLRWAHGYRGREACRAVEKLNLRLGKLIRNFNLSLTAA